MADVCIVNIGPRERRRRFISGWVLLAVAVALCAALVASGSDRLWRLTVFLPAAASAAGFFQSRAKT